MLRKIGELWESHNKHAILQTMQNLFKQFGFRGVYRGIYNKLHGYPLLMGIAGETGNMGVHTREEYDRRGRKILEQQQGELTPLEQLERIKLFGHKPKLSVIMPLYNAPTKWLEPAITSIQKQSYINWELCMVDDGSKDLRGQSLVEALQKKDDRLKFRRLEQNSGIATASNVALEMAQGEYIVLVDQDDELTPDAFFWIVSEINEHPDAELLYSDECKTQSTVKPSPCDFYFKPDWSPELLINHMYIGHLTVYRTAVVRSVGGFRKQYDFSQDYDLALRVTEKATAIRHIERVLYYWRMLPSSGAGGGKDFARISNIAALQDAYLRRGLNAVTHVGGYANYGRLIMPENPLISVVIPTDSTKTLKMCINGLVGDATAYKNLEIIPVTNSKTAEEIQACFPYLTNLKLCRYDKIYNFSDKCNAGAQIATGKYLVIYNDDVFPFSRDWVERMLEILQYEGVGAVSPMMIYEDQTIQYAGMICNVPGQVGTSFNGVPFVVGESSPFSHFLMRDISVLSGACVMLPKALYKQIDGFDAVHTPTGHSDVDLSFKILERGLRCVYTPHAVLTHIGNHSWEAKNKQDKAHIYCLKRWGKYIGDDRYFTNSMRAVYYFDQSIEYKIYSPKKLINADNPNARDILFVSHELSLTGAPILLMDAVIASMERGDFPVIICPVDGPLRKTYLEMGVTVIIDESVIKRQDLFECFARNFDLVVVNTLVLTEAIKSLSGSLPAVLWWIHDGVDVIAAVHDKIPHKIEKNIHIYCGSEYSQRLISRFGNDYHSEILRYGVKDLAGKSLTAVQKPEKLIFLTVGSLERRKAQDVLLKAIEKLPPAYQAKAEFVIIGNPLQPEILHMIQDYEKKYECVSYRKIMPREDLLKLYPQSICSIIPSRDEPTSMIGIESMMFSRAIISSNNTGIGEFVQNEEDGYIFHNENAEELAEILKQVIDDPQKMLQMGTKAREIYEYQYRMSMFEDRYNHITEHLLGEKNS